MSQATDFSVPTTGPSSPSNMALRIDDSLKALLSHHSGASRPSYAVDGTFWMSTATTGKRKIYVYDGNDDHLIQTLDLATGKITYGDGTTDDAIGAQKWRARLIGESVFVRTDLTGVEIPPSSTTDTIWIELTAGLTGSGAFNSGKLTSESVSGSAPMVIATAVINFAASPINGQTINLLNTEGRILRPSTSPGTIQADALQGHVHTGGIGVTAGAIYSNTPRNEGTNINTGSPITDGANGTPRTASETRMKNIGVKAYMRIA